MIQIDLDMPTACAKCPFCDYEQGLCSADRRGRNAADFANSGKGKPDWCPCREIPDKAAPDDKQWLRDNYAAQLAALGYGPDGNALAADV